MKREFKAFEEAKAYLRSVGCHDYCVLNLGAALLLSIRDDMARVYWLFCSEARGTYTITGGKPQRLKYNSKGAYVVYFGNRYHLDEFMYSII